MNLWEGNWAACWWGDYTQGSSSYLTAFRNSFSGKQTSYSLMNPWLWTVIEVETYNRYFNLIGNILGNATMTGGTVINNGSGGPLPTMFRFGYSSTGGCSIRIPFHTPRQFFMGTTISSAIRSTTGLVRIILCRYLYIIPPSQPSLEI